MGRGLSKYAELTSKIIGACFEVHKILGPGLQERFYRDALAHELELRGFKVQREQAYTVEYKGRELGVHRLDLVVENTVLLELKAIEGKLLDIHIAQTLSERRVSKLPVALLINFGDASVEIRRLERRD